MLRAASVLLVLLITGGLQSTAVVRAATPANINIVPPLNQDPPRILWDGVLGTAQYRLTGTILLARVNADDPVCSPPLAEDRRNLTLNEVLDGSATQFQLPLPELPSADAWFFFDVRVTLNAFDDEGVLQAQGSAMGIAETPRCPTSTAAPVLPPTGAGAARSKDAKLNVYLLLAAAAAAGALAALALRKAMARA